MTIAAGFVNREGILLCADTEEQQGAMKGHRPKIITFDWKGRAGAFAFAGNSDFAITALQKFKSKLESTSSQNILEVVENTLTAEYTRLVFKHPSYKADWSSIAFWILAALPMPNGDVRLFKSNEASLQEVEHFAAIGIGDTFARHIVGKSFIGGMSERRTLQVAAYMLKMTEQHVPGCSRPFHIKSLRNDGSVADFSNDQLVEYTEQWEPLYDAMSQQLFFGLMDERNDDQSLEENIHIFMTGVQEIRKNWRKRHNVFFNAERPRD